MDTAALADRYESASEETRRLIDRLLAEDADDRAWREQLGPVYRQATVAELLGKSKQAVSADSGLLRLRLRDGRVGYPVFQFDGRRVCTGLRDVVNVLLPAVETAWTVASWLTTPHPQLDGHRPMEALREGRTEEVVALARRTGRALAA